MLRVGWKRTSSSAWILLVLSITMCVSCFEDNEIPVTSELEPDLALEHENIRQLTQEEIDSLMVKFSYEEFLEKYYESEERPYELVRDFFPKERTRLHKQLYKEAVLKIGYSLPLLDKEKYRASSEGINEWEEMDRHLRRYLNSLHHERAFTLENVYHDLFNPNSAKWHVQGKNILDYEDEMYHDKRHRHGHPGDVGITVSSEMQPDL